MQLSFKNRIALYYIISTALLVFVVFFAVYSTVKHLVFQSVTEDIEKEIKMHQAEMKFNGKQIVWINKEEWEEKEHNVVNLNPVFVQITDLQGRTIEKSPNLKKEHLEFQENISSKTYKNSTINHQDIKLSQTPIFDKEKKVGYLLIAMSIEHPLQLLESLKTILFILYPIVLIVLFLVARIIAGRSIQPVNEIIRTSGLITKDNLGYRMELPKNKDEIYSLSENINKLLDRIESAVEREKQFTSDASHELRTPLAVIKGTLEVLIRKPREKEEYENKIIFCISEVDRLNNLVDELLLLARFENQKANIRNTAFSLNTMTFETLARFSDKITNDKINIKTNFEKDFQIHTDPDKFQIILSNLVSNALKYCNKEGEVMLSAAENEHQLEFQITNTGTGIPTEDIDKVFRPFFRSHSSDITAVKGVGLGLSIVKKLCDLLQINIQIESNTNQKTTFKLIFKK
ncbi:sensor histidine kinase [Flavobacterium suncheonense]|uniref:sensor histidine kinase n=1 Tax=Flavobacterium suncheonense TaxID=350894 RepID=UPI003FA3A001